MRKGGVGCFSDVDGRAGARGQFFVSGDEVGVKMGLKNVPDFKLLLLRGFQINFNVTLRIDDYRFAF